MIDAVQFSLVFLSFCFSLLLSFFHTNSLAVCVSGFISLSLQPMQRFTNQTPYSIDSFEYNTLEWINLYKANKWIYFPPQQHNGMHSRYTMPDNKTTNFHFIFPFVSLFSHSFSPARDNFVIFFWRWNWSCFTVCTICHTCATWAQTHKVIHNTIRIAMPQIHWLIKAFVFSENTGR